MKRPLEKPKVHIVLDNAATHKTPEVHILSRFLSY